MSRPGPRPRRRVAAGPKSSGMGCHLDEEAGVTSVGHERRVEEAAPTSSLCDHGERLVGLSTKANYARAHAERDSIQIDRDAPGGSGLSTMDFDCGMIIPPVSAPETVVACVKGERRPRGPRDSGLWQGSHARGSSGRAERPWRAAKRRTGSRWLKSTDQRDLPAGRDDGIHAIQGRPAVSTATSLAGLTKPQIGERLLTSRDTV